LQCGQRAQPIKNLIIISAGFGESGDVGREREKQLSFLVKQYQLKIAGPNCLGMINPWKNFNASFSGALAKSGNVGLIMQSGAFVSAFLDWAQTDQVGFSAIATIGNKTFLDEIDFLEYLAKDEKTKVIGLYLEGIKRGKILCQKIKKISQKKPVLLLLAEGGNKTQAAAVSHTAALAGESLVAKKALERSGALVFSKVSDFWLALVFFSQFKLPVGQKILLITNAGGPAVVAMGLAEKSSLVEIFELTKEQKKILKEFLPISASVNNPLDLLGDADEERYRQVLEKIKFFPQVGAGVILVTRQKQTAVEKIAKVIEKIQGECEFPLVPVFMTNVATTKKLNFKNFSCFEEALIGLEAGIAFSQKPISAPSKIVFETNSSRSQKTKKIFLQAQKDGRVGLFYKESRQLLAEYGLTAAVSQDWVQGEVFSADFFPAVLKVDDPKIIHKDVQRGVVMGIENQKQLEKEAERLKKFFPQSRLIVQPQQEIDLEIILGIKKDPVFGQVVLAGLGGVAADFLGEKLFFFPFLDKGVVETRLKGSILEKIFQKKKISLEKLAEEIEKLLCLAEENSWLKEMDINPILVYSHRDFVAVDVKVLF